MYILLAILIFGLLILVHEFGHFLAAKLLDVQVNEFSLCMGPALFQRKKGETTYSLRLIPIGGYCAMEGEDEQSENPRAFTSKPVWTRAVILVAGVFMNFLTGLLILAILLSTSAGFYSPVITDFEEGCPYQGEDALQVGDEILSVDGEKVYIYSDLSMLWARSSTGVYDMVVRRNGEKVTLKDFSFTRINYGTEEEPDLRYGLYFGNIIPKTAGSVLSMSWRNAMDFLRLTRMGLMDLISGLVSVDEMAGPVGIVSVISETGKNAETTSAALSSIAYLAAFLAVDLAFMNLLPIPALDGGRLFLLIITAIVEKLTRKKINPKYEGYIHAAGMVALLAFMAFITFKDILKLFGR